MYCPLFSFALSSKDFLCSTLGLKLWKLHICFVSLIITNKVMIIMIKKPLTSRKFMAAFLPDGEFGSYQQISPFVAVWSPPKYGHWVITFHRKTRNLMKHLIYITSWQILTISNGFNHSPYQVNTKTNSLGILNLKTTQTSPHRTSNKVFRNLFKTILRFN